MLTSSDTAQVLPILRSIGAFVYLVDVLDDGYFRYFAVNWSEDADIELPYKGSIVGKRPDDVFELEHASRIKQYYRQCIDQRSQIEFEGSFVSPSGKRFTNHFLSPLYDLNGRIVRIMGTIVDITRRKEAEKALKASESRYHSLYDDNPAKFITIDPKGTILSVNNFGAQYSGFSREELINTSLFDHVLKDDRRFVKEFLQDTLQKPDGVHRAEFRSLKKDGTAAWMSNTARITENEEGKSVILIVSEDISETCKLAEELTYEATHDSLTSLVNRREFERRLQDMLESAQAEKLQHALIYLDLDQFKIINDIYGHIAGDELLRQLSRLLQEKIRKSDTLARLGGDEFGLLMVDCSLDRAEKMSRALRKVVEDYQFLWRKKRYNIGVSLGVVPITETSGSMTNVLSAADRACYAAKDKGRNRIHVFRQDDEELERRHGEMEWVNRIKHAMAEHRFHLYFQPIAPLIENTEDGEYYELLLRLEDEQGAIVSTGTFLPAAERYQLVTKLDHWVVKTAFEWLNSNPDHINNLSLCSINVSGSSVGEEAFLAFVVRTFDDMQVPPEKICFEITETAAITHLSGTMKFIQTLKERGCRFSLDDFGSGLSSFAYLKNLPVDYLKIDGTFVRDIADDPINLAMVKSINDIGHVMGKKTIAESVENDHVLGKLKEIGVDYFQGYGIGYPQPIRQK